MMIVLVLGLLPRPHIPSDSRSNAAMGGCSWFVKRLQSGASTAWGLATCSRSDLMRFSFEKIREGFSRPSQSSVAIRVNQVVFQVNAAWDSWTKLPSPEDAFHLAARSFEINGDRRVLHGRVRLPDALSSLTYRGSAHSIAGVLKP